MIIRMNLYAKFATGLTHPKLSVAVQQKKFTPTCDVEGVHVTVILVDLLRIWPFLGADLIIPGGDIVEMCVILCD